MRASPIHSLIAARAMRPVVMTAEDVAEFGELSRLGIHLDAADVRGMIAGLDAAPDIAPTVFNPTVTTPVQFLQNWLPGFVTAITQARLIDDLIGVATVGDWEDEEIVQGVLEPAGLAQLYGDYTNVPFSSWNLGFERRTIVRFEMGMQVGHLEEKRSAKVKVATAARKRASAALALEIQRNRVGFYGFNGGANRTYGFLNEPSLPAYVTFANGASASPLWSSKTFLEIIADFRTAMAKLITQAGGVIKASDAITVAIPLGKEQFLSVTSDFGVSVQDWLKKTYPNLRIVSAPELTGANGGVDAFYMYAESVQDGESDDGGQTFMQIVPTKFATVGTAKGSKSYEEDYTNASAGVLLKRPYAVVRYSGL